MEYRSKLIIMMAVAATVATVLVPESAQAYIPGPPCYGSSCVGKSPYIVNQQGYSCVTGAPGENNGATTIASWYDGGDAETVYLRWSAYCGANWAKISDNAADSEGDAPEWWAQSEDMHVENPEGSGYTYMVNGTEKARACGIPFDVHTTYCTPWE